MQNPNRNEFHLDNNEECKYDANGNKVQLQEGNEGAMSYQQQIRKIDMEIKELKQ